MKQRWSVGSLGLWLVVAVGVAAVPLACGGSDETRTGPVGDAGGDGGSAVGVGGDAKGGRGGAAPVGGAGEPIGGGAGGGATEAGGSGGGAGEGGCAGEGGDDSSAGAAAQGGEGGAGGAAPYEGDCADVSLLVNCGFELPAAPSGGFVLRAKDQDLGGWLVIGSTGNVGTLSTTFADGGLTWPAQEGAQSLDLTGITNSATGVSQDVVTVAGAQYELSFWSGNISHNGVYGTQSTVTVLVEGQEVLEPTNPAGAGTSTLAWEQYTTTFTAADASTSISFVNADGAGDNSNVIDNVVLRLK